MNNQVKTALKMFVSVIIITLVLDVMLQNVIFSSAISFLICVVYFYDPRKVEARYNKEKGETVASEVTPSNIESSKAEPSNIKKNKKNKKKIKK